MKKVLGLLAVVLIFVLPSYGSNGIITEENYLSVLKKGKQQNKSILLILGSYSNQKEENNPFLSQISKSFYQENFIVAKYKNNNQLYKQLETVLGVGTYPVLYFFNSEGTLLYMDMGAKNSKELLELGKKVVSMESIEDKTDFLVGAPYNKLQRKWYTSKAIGLYASLKMKIEREDNSILVKYLDGDYFTVESYIKKGFKRSSQNDYLYYLMALVLYDKSFYHEAKKYAYTYKSRVEEEHLSPNIMKNLSILLN